MVPFDPLVGEFRVHYAGFFDPASGYEGAGGRGAARCSSVRSREVPFILGTARSSAGWSTRSRPGAADDALWHGHRLDYRRRG